MLHHHRMLHEAFDHAVGWQLLATNPAAAAKPPRAERPDIAVLEPDQVAQLMEAASSFPEPYPTVVTLALATGMRQGEILALRWQDVDLKSGLITVVRTARRYAGLGIVYGEPKTYRSRRPLKLAADTVATLRAHHARQAEARLLAGPAWVDQDLVFTGPVGQPIDARNLLDWFRKMTEAADIGRIPFHALRHTCATMMVMAGVNPRTVADRLGHANATFTINTYCHTTSEAEAQAAEAVAAVLRRPAR